MMQKTMRFGVLIVLLIAAVPALARIPAFPGAEGFGAYATGGRGGDVYTVTSLNNNGAGTLREALATAPPEGRTIVFAVSGYIPVVSDTNFQVPHNVTLAGQTAPGDGVGLQGGRMLISGDNVIMRHFRIRHGKNGTGGDCLNLSSGAHDSIIDHVTMMFSTDESFSFFNSTLNNFTMQYSTSSWGMERHNAGGLWDLVDGSCHHSLWAHHSTRNPKARPYGLLEWVNNVTYHWRKEGFIMGDSQSDVDWYANVIGCYFLSIADYEFGLKSKALTKARIASDGRPNFHLHLADCLHDADGDGLLNGTDKGYDIVDGRPYPLAGTTPGTASYDQVPAPHPGAPVAVSVDDPLTAYKKVISSGGALRLDASASSLRDELDTLLIDSVVNQYPILVQKDGKVAGEDPDRTSNGEQLLADQYGISNHGFGTLRSATAPPDSDGDGMPDDWEQALGSNPGVQDHNSVFANDGSFITTSTFFPPRSPAGYTYLEEYLHFCAIPHARIARNTVASPSSITVDLSRYTCGFTNGASFTISNTYGGTIQQFAADGTTPSSSGPVVLFTPTQDVAGRAGLDFQVTDADGSRWTQSFGLLVVNTENDPPMPNPATFATPPAATGSTKITMTATPGSDASGPVQYYFACIAGGGHDRDWQTSPTYTDSGLRPDTEYVYTVSMRDSALTPNVGTASVPRPATTFASAGAFLERGGVLSMEAESGTLGSRWMTGADAGASNGTYIEVHPSFGHTGSAPEGTTAEYVVSYEFNISTGGDFSFFYRLYSSGGEDDSFFWRIDDGSWNVENLRSGIGSWFSTDNAQVDSLSAGSHVLEITYREDGTRIDKFVIQLDSVTDPSGDGAAESAREDANAPPQPPVAYHRFEEGVAGADVLPGGDAVTDTAGGDDTMNAGTAGAAPTYSPDVPLATIPQTGEANVLSTYYDGSDDVYSSLSGPLNTTVFTNFTVEAYVKFSNLSGYQTIVGRDDSVNASGGQDGNPQALFYLSKHNDGHFRVEASTVGGDMVMVEGSVHAATGIWYHVAAVCNASAGTLTLYVDGEYAGSTTGYDGMFDPAEDTAWTIGRGQYNGSPADNVIGYIDEVRFTPGALARKYFLNVYNADYDDDGLADAWERRHFGNLEQTGTDDPDGDGGDNETEETNGTPPTISSVPPTLDASIAVGMLHLNWPSNHTGWRLLQTIHLTSAHWTGVVGSDTTNGVVRPVSGLPADTTFYRLVYP